MMKNNSIAVLSVMCLLSSISYAGKSNQNSPQSTALLTQQHRVPGPPTPGGSKTEFSTNSGRRYRVTSSGTTLMEEFEQGIPEESKTQEPSKTQEKELADSKSDKTVHNTKRWKYALVGGGLGAAIIAMLYTIFTNESSSESSDES